MAAPAGESGRAQQLSVAGGLLSQSLERDVTDAAAAELSRSLDDSSVPHRYYYQPYTDEDVRGPAAVWKVRSHGRTPRLR